MIAASDTRPPWFGRARLLLLGAVAIGILTLPASAAPSGAMATVRGNPDEVVVTNTDATPVPVNVVNQAAATAPVLFHSDTFLAIEHGFSCANRDWDISAEGQRRVITHASVEGTTPAGVGIKAHLTALNPEVGNANFYFPLDQPALHWSADGLNRYWATIELQAVVDGPDGLVLTVCLSEPVVTTPGTGLNVLNVSVSGYTVPLPG